MRSIGTLCLGLLVSGLAACQDLDVVYENLPDTERALREPPEVEQVIISSFRIWRNPFNNGDFSRYVSIIGSEVASTVVFRQIQPSFEPRLGLKNDPVADEVWIPRNPWDQYNSALANATDGLLRILKDGLVIETPDAAGVVADNTDRARIFGKLIEGMSLGYLSLVFDRNAPRTHDDVLPKGYDEVVAWEVDNLKPYPEVAAVAVGILEDAIADIDASPPFTLPIEWMSTEYTSDQLRQIANSFIARILVYSPRTPEERAEVDWQRVLSATAEGLTFDFSVVLGFGTGAVGTGSHLGRIQHNTQGYRASYWWIGAADVSGSFQAWAASPLEERNRFDIVTPDRRITGPLPTDDGAYFRYRENDSGFDVTRGTYNFSAYQWYRNSGNSRSGDWILMSEEENQLLRAEAFLRTGDAQEAANLINASRTRPVMIGTSQYDGLPPVTADGVTDSADCVPRSAEGDCGSLMEALMYEREIEAGGWDPVRTWADRRGLGTLITGTTLHLPIPGRYLVSMGIPIYSFGGVGGPGAAQ